MHVSCEWWLTERVSACVCRSNNFSVSYGTWYMPPVEAHALGVGDQCRESLVLDFFIVRLLTSFIVFNTLQFSYHHLNSVWFKSKRLPEKKLNNLKKTKRSNKQNQNAKKVNVKRIWQRSKILQKLIRKSTQSGKK